LIKRVQNKNKIPGALALAQAHFAGHFFSGKNILYGHFCDNIPEGSIPSSPSPSNAPFRSVQALARSLALRHHREGNLLRPPPASRAIDGKAVSLY
jgi:hypothetical protein